MGKSLKFTIFKTKWGYFGLAGSEIALCRSCLPLPEPERVKSQLLKNPSLPNNKSSIQFDKTLFRPLQEQIIAYFEGACIDFDSDIPIILNGFSSFTCSVLSSCRKTGFAQTITYAGLASKIGRPAASRAVGNALAMNPMPLIIPCHRVIRSDGRIGGFSAAGGKNLKARLLKHEKLWNLT